MMLSIAFPAYNEEKIIRKTLLDAVTELEQLEKIHSFNWELVIVDDGSVDGTKEILESLVQEVPNLRVISHTHNMGYSKAIKTCLERSIGDFILVVDSDGQFRLTDLPKFIYAMSRGFDLVVGYKTKRRDPRIRVLMGKVFNFIFRNMFHVKLHDIDCGYRLFKRELAKRITLEKVGFPNAPIGPLVIVSALSLGYKITEVPVQHFPRETGKSVYPIYKVPIIASIALIDLIKLWKYSRQKNTF